MHKSNEKVQSDTNNNSTNKLNVNDHRDGNSYTFPFTKYRYRE